MDGWTMDEEMGGVSKKLKLGIIYYMPKTFIKAEGENYIQEKDENNLGICLFSIKKKIQVEGRKI
jgi:hypothetical protein